MQHAIFVTPHLYFDFSETLILNKMMDKWDRYIETRALQQRTLLEFPLEHTYVFFYFYVA